MSAASLPSIEDLAGDPAPAWLWDVARRRIAWGNAAAVRFWGEDSLLDLIELEFDPDDTAVLKLDRLATEFEEGTPLTRKLEFDLASGRQWVACCCFPAVLDDGRPGLLVQVAPDDAESRSAFSRFGEMVQEAPVAMALFGSDGLLLHQNMEAEHLFGALARQGGLGALLPDEEDALPLIARTIRSGTVSRALTLTTRHGARAHRVTLRRVHDPDTDAHALLVLFRDIADRRARDRDAARERSQIQSMLDLVSDFQWRLDKDLRFVQITGDFQETTGVKPEALLGKTWDGAVRQFGLGPGPSLSKALASQTAWRDQDLLWPKLAQGAQGEVLRLLLSALPLKDAAGRFAGWNGVAMRARPQRAAAPAPHGQAAPPPDAEESLLTSVTDGILMLGEDGTVIRASKRAEALLGPLAGKPLEIAFRVDEQPRLRDYLASLAGTGLAAAYDNGLEMKTGGLPPRDLLVVIQRLGSDYAGAAFTAALRDVTAAKRSEADLRHALNQAKAANTQKSDFLASVAHELRTPLNAIIGFSEIMRDERYGELGDERYLSYASDIHDSGELLLSLINDLLDLSKVEAGKFDPTFEQVDVAAIVDQCVTMVKPGAADERIGIRAQIADRLPGLVADKRSLLQILLNLLSNAVKFTRAGGQVTVSAELSAHGDLVLAVQDTGIGMSDEDLERALAPFGQARSAVIHGKKGTGLGLPLAKALTEANRGALTITSAPGEGTRVELSFPPTQVLQD